MCAWACWIWSVAQIEIDLKLYSINPWTHYSFFIDVWHLIITTIIIHCNIYDLPAWARWSISFSVSHMNYIRWNPNVEDKSWWKCWCRHISFVGLGRVHQLLYLRWTYISLSNWRQHLRHTTETHIAGTRVSTVRSTGYLYSGRSNSYALHHRNGHQNKSKQCDTRRWRIQDNNNEKTEAADALTKQKKKTHIGKRQSNQHYIRCGLCEYAANIYWPTRRFRCGRCLSKIDRGISIYIYGIWSYWFFPFCVASLACHPVNICF